VADLQPGSLRQLHQTSGEAPRQSEVCWYSRGISAAGRRHWRRDRHSRTAGRPAAPRDGRLAEWSCGVRNL